MIEKGACINRLNAEGKSPLHTFYNEVVGAVILCHGQFLEVGAKDQQGRILLHYLAYSNQSTAADVQKYSSDKECLFARDNEGKMPLHFAAQRGNIALTEHFLHHPMSSRFKDAVDCKARSAFHNAVKSKRVHVIDVLRSHDLDIFRRDGRGRSVLHQAARHDNVEAVKRVIALAGEQELRVRDNDGSTPLQLAHRKDARAVVDYVESTYGLLVEGAQALSGKGVEPEARGGREGVSLEGFRMGFEDVALLVGAVLFLAMAWMS